MLPREKDYAKVTRRLELVADRPPANSDEVIVGFVDASSDLLDVHSACWHQTDPAVGAPLRSGAAGEPPGSLEEALQYEYRRPDVNAFHRLQAQGMKVATIFGATGRRPHESSRFREMIEPEGPADELRLTFRDGFGTWACLVVFTGRPLEERDCAFLADVLPTVTRSVREATAAENAQPSSAPVEDGGPSVVLIDGEDRILAADAVARRRLSRLPEVRPVEVPGVIAFLAAKARHGVAQERATARTRTLDGRWFALDASRLDDDGSVAVVLQPALPTAVLDGVLRSLGLTTREREVAILAAEGQSTKAIAQTLVLSPWTVQDHLKAVFEKTGCGGRADLSAICR